MIAWSRARVVMRAGSAAALSTVLLCLQPANVACAQGPAKSAAPLPDLEAYIRSGMKAYDVPGLAVGIVTGVGERPSGFAQFEAPGRQARCAPPHDG